MSIQIKRRRKSTKSQTARSLTQPKYVGGKKQTLKPGPFVEVKWCSEILHRATANVRVWRATRSCETNSAERFKGRRFIPTGISSCSLSQACDHSLKYLYITPTATTRGVCSKPQQLHGENKRENRNCGVKKMYTRVSARTNVLQRYVLFMHMTSLENFNILASQKVCGIPFKRNFPKARGQNRAVSRSRVSGFGGSEDSHHSLGNMNSDGVTF